MTLVEQVPGIHASGGPRCSTHLWEPTVCGKMRGRAGAYSSRPLAARLAFVRICAHYFSNGAWLEESALLRDANRLRNIPGVLIHGRLDMGSPLLTAWELAQAWPDARLIVIDDSGHTGSDGMRNATLSALRHFAIGDVVHGSVSADCPTSLDNGRRSPKKFLRAVVARLLGRKP